MPNLDIIRLALAARVDWGEFESMVCAILAEDDLPKLRRLGGIADLGGEAVEEGFYADEAQHQTIVQVTSDAPQDSRFQRTIHRLTRAGVACSQLVIVYRQPVDSATRQAIGKRASALSIAVDVRDADYLIHHLANAGNGIYARHFGDSKQQLEALLDGEDPLDVVPDRARRAVLASIGAYVLLPHGRLARRTLFQRTVLASLASAGGAVTVGELLNSLRELLPDEDLDSSRLRAAIDALAEEKQCEVSGDGVALSSEGAAALGGVLAGARAAVERLQEHVLERGGSDRGLDQVTRERLIRNTRRAVAGLLPLRGGPQAGGTLPDTLAEGLKPEVARRALLGLLDHLREPGHHHELALLMHPYAALAIRDLDPVGRRWQQTALERSTMALDTDVVVRLIVDELPGAAAVRAALNALTDCGVKLVVPEWVMAETMEHLARAPRSWGHLDLEEMLRGRIACSVSAFADVPAECEADLEEIAAAVMRAGPRTRWKASAYGEDRAARRLAEDVRTAMAMATAEKRARSTAAAGYVVSCDEVFRFFEAHDAWKGRPRVHVPTGMLPALATFVAGSAMDGQAFMQLLAEPAGGPCREG